MADARTVRSGLKRRRHFDSEHPGLSVACTLPVRSGVPHYSPYE